MFIVKYKVKKFIFTSSGGCIYGETKTFDLNSIQKNDSDVSQKSKYISLHFFIE